MAIASRQDRTYVSDKKSLSATTKLDFESCCCVAHDEALCKASDEHFFETPFARKEDTGSQAAGEQGTGSAVVMRGEVN
jgi:hypothetical protein